MESLCPRCNKRARTTARRLCKPCERTYNQEAYKRYARERYIQKRYGISEAEYDALMEDAICAICSAPAENLDHCHASGNVRAPLCGPCNRMLGQARDDPSRLRDGAAYLEQYG